MGALTKSVDAAVHPLADDDAGEFEMILSDDTLDRDNESLFAYDWRDPLPESIPLKANHSRDVSDIVGSGTPYLDSDGSLRVRGSYASTALGQHIRRLVREGHVRSVSAEFLRHDDGTAELVAGAFGSWPDHPCRRGARRCRQPRCDHVTDCRWLSAIPAGFLLRLRPGLLGQYDETVADSPIDPLPLIRAGDSAATAKATERVGAERIRAGAGRCCYRNSGADSDSDAD